MSATIIFAINFILYLWLLVKYKKKNKIDVYILLVGFYMMLAIASFIYVFQFAQKSGEKVTYHLIPLLFLYSALGLLLVPIKRYSRWDKIAIIKPSNGKLKIIIAFIVVSVLVRIPSILLNFTETVQNALLDSALFYNTYNDHMSTYMEVQRKESFNILTIILGALDCYIPFFLMYYLTLKNRNKLVTGALVLGMLISPISGLGNAQRGIILSSLLSVVVAYFIFNDYIDGKIRKIVKVIGLSFVGLIVLMLSIITISRFSQDFMEEGNATRSIFAYAGQPMLNFSSYGFEPGGIRHGDRTIPLVKSVLHIGGAYDYAHRMEAYPNLKMHEGIFSTFIGDFVSDYGVIVTIFIVIFMFAAFSHMIGIKKGKMSMDRLLALYILSYIMLCGWNLYPFADFGGNLHLFIGITMYVFFMLDRKLLLKKAEK